LPKFGLNLSSLHDWILELCLKGGGVDRRIGEITRLLVSIGGVRDLRGEIYAAMDKPAVSCGSEIANSLDLWFSGTGLEKADGCGGSRLLK
jgi:hypothetical protein